MKKRGLVVSWNRRPGRKSHRMIRVVGLKNWLILTRDTQRRNDTQQHATTRNNTQQQASIIRKL